MIEIVGLQIYPSIRHLSAYEQREYTHRWTVIWILASIDIRNSRKIGRRLLGRLKRAAKSYSNFVILYNFYRGMSLLIICTWWKRNCLWGDTTSEMVHKSKRVCHKIDHENNQRWNRSKLCIRCYLAALFFQDHGRGNWRLDFFSAFRLKISQDMSNAPCLSGSTRVLATCSICR